MMDASWSMSGGDYNSLTGRGNAVGISMGKCIDFVIKSKTSMVSQIASKSGKGVRDHTRSQRIVFLFHHSMCYLLLITS